MQRTRRNFLDLFRPCGNLKPFEVRRRAAERNRSAASLAQSAFAIYHARMEFEWEPDKAARNLTKHGVSFAEAATIFGDPLAITSFDPDHSDEEDRFLTFGHSSEGHLLVVSHTDRHDRTRIISARQATRNEKQQYEQGQQKGRGR